ncbi:MAG: hypothetical protein ACLTZB_03240 [Streptococcus salivarius]
MLKRLTETLGMLLLLPLLLVSSWSTFHFGGGAILNLLGTEQSVTQAGSLYLALVVEEWFS